MKLASNDGIWTAETVHLACTGSSRDGWWIRVRKFGLFVGEFRTPAELDAIVPLATMHEVS